jgi:hypothetical protein
MTSRTCCRVRGEKQNYAPGISEHRAGNRVGILYIANSHRNEHTDNAMLDSSPHNSMLSVSVLCHRKDYKAMERTVSLGRRFPAQDCR